jgi:hypothetical protein
MMFNSPPGHYVTMDIAKMLAVKEMISTLTNSNFRIWWQTRTGLLSYPVDMDKARAHLATSIYIQMALQPNIVHVVGYSEANHAATADEVIESCKIARQSAESAVWGQPDLIGDPAIQERKKELLQEADILLNAIHQLGSKTSGDPLADSKTLAKAVTVGLLDAPQLVNNDFAKGEIATWIDHRGACITVDPVSGEPIQEKQRVSLREI